MPERPASERTEAATPERLKKAREEGQIPESRELPSAIMIGVLLLSLGLLGEGMFRWLVREVRWGVAIRPVGSSDASVVPRILQDKAAGALRATVPFLVLAAAGSVFASLLTSGWNVSPKAAGVRLDRISPVTGLKNLFSARSLVRLGISLLKLAVILGIVWFYLSDKLAACCALRWTTAAGTVAGIGRLVVGLMGRIVVAIFVIAAIDVLYQRRKYRKELRMTKQEVKEERKQHEISPELRGRMRNVQVELVRKRMLQEVPNADVVITNPTHVAVALRYEPGTMGAPKMVAKGAELLCEKIKEIARAHGVPIVQRPELARAIYAAVEVGRPIPEVLFVAVAEVLAMIYRLRRRRLGV
ncbi:MAG TPA: flagellar biosynthesis protein FlhB [Phycisphaerae bacterium]|nr:flagellar biosynthesis protein FlhB [Phycisphaerae bacterium]